MAKISLKVIIAGLFIAVVCLVAGLTLGITYTVSYNALQAIGFTHAVAMAGPVSAKCETYFGKASDQLIALRRNSNESGVVRPTNEANIDAWARKWTVPLRDMLISGNKAYALVSVMFLDGSLAQAYYEPNFPDRLSMYALDARTLPTSTRFKETYDLRNGGFIRITDPTDPVIIANNDTADSRSTVFQRAIVSTRTAGVSQVTASSIALYDLQSTGQLIFGLPFWAPLHNRTGVVLGYASLIVSITDINTFLQSIRATPRTQAFIVDSSAFLVAASDPKASFVSFESQPASTPERLGCASTKFTSVKVPASVWWGCRTPMSRYTTFPPLVAVSSSELMRAPNTTVSSVTVDNEVYFVAAVPLNASLKQFGMRLFVFLPEADVIGDVVTGRNIALGVSAGTIVLAVIIAIVVLNILLSPLHVIAIRMRAAAALEDDFAKGTISSLKEVAEIEAAYYELNDQLLRIKDFVPSSVKATNVDEDDEEEAKRAADHDNKTQRGEDDEGSARMVADDQSEGSIHSVTARSNATKTSRSIQGTAKPDARHMLKQSARGLVAMSGRSARHIPIKQLNLTASLTNTRCSVLAGDCRGFHGYTKRVGSEQLVGLFGQSMGLINSIVNDQKGVIDVFQGDHITISFNAVKPCAAHARRATVCGLRLAEELALKGYALPMCSGVSTGMALCGNVGSPDCMRYNIIGPVVTQATVLRRICRIYNASVMVPQAVFPDLETQVNYSVVDIVKLPGATRPIRIGKAIVELNRGEAADDEWMYLLQGNDSEQRNKAFEDLANGELGTAQDYLRKFNREGANAETLTIVEKMTALVTMPGSERCTDLGEFYSAHLPSKERQGS